VAVEESHSEAGEIQVTFASKLTSSKDFVRPFDKGSSKLCNFNVLNQFSRLIIKFIFPYTHSHILFYLNVTLEKQLLFNTLFSSLKKYFLNANNFS